VIQPGATSHDTMAVPAPALRLYTSVWLDCSSVPLLLPVVVVELPNM
jgi:hypothetical protein